MPRLLTAAEAASRLGVKPATLYAYVSRGTLRRQRAADGRTSLFDAASLDPDILTEKARALLQMAQPDDLIVMTDPKTGLPISGSAAGLAANQSTPTIAAGID